MTAFKIFLSSPGDCADERAAMRSVSERLNADPLVNANWNIDVVAWDWDGGIPMDALTPPQAAVDSGISKPEECDLFIGIFRERFGTPLPVERFGRKDDGSQFLSGSEYEFHCAKDSRRRGAGHPAIFIYRLDAQAQETSSEDEQRERVEDFFRKPPFTSGIKAIGGYKRFKNVEEFTDIVERDIKALLAERITGSRKSADNWLREQAQKLTALAGPRYTADAHLETDTSKIFDWLLARKPAIERLDDALAKIWKEIFGVPQLESQRTNLAEFAETLRRNPLWDGSLPDFSGLCKVITEVREIAIGEQDRLYELFRAQKTQSPEERKGQEELRHWGEVRSIANEALEIISDNRCLAEKRVLLLTGPAGQGKTHTLVHEVRRIVEGDGIAVGVLGQTLSGTGDLWPSILHHVGFAGSVDEFLDGLETAAARKKERALIVIDAPNETPGYRRWRTSLSGILNDILRRPHLTVALGVRSDYLNHVLPTVPEGESPPWDERTHEGFSGISAEDLVGYFAHYGATAPVAPPIGELSNPLFVQLLAKSMRGQSSITHWIPSWLEVWGRWIDCLEDEARNTISDLDHSRPEPIRRVLDGIARRMLEIGNFALSRSEADEVAKQVSGIGGIITRLCSAGALITYLSEDDEEHVQYAFDRLSDTFLADRIIRNLFAGVTDKKDKYEKTVAAFGESGLLHILVQGEYSDNPLWGRREGLLSALCLALPRHIGAELPMLFKKNAINHWDWELSRAFQDSLLWRCRPEEFGCDEDTLWELWNTWRFVNYPQYDLDQLIRFGLIPGHPFSIEHVIHPWLMDMDSLGARDAAWSVDLVPLWVNDESTLNVVVKWAKTAPLRGLHPEMAVKAAKLLAWTCAVSDENLREDAICGLTRVLVACPQVSTEILDDFMTVNDAYVIEGVLVAVLGVVTDNSSPKNSAICAQKVFNAIFPAGPLPWCHLTIRHYARKIVEVAAEKGLIPEIPIASVRPPYKSTLPLDEVPDKENLEKLDESTGFRRIVYSATDGDFYLYEIGGNSNFLDFYATPLATSSEPSRPFVKVERIGLSRGANPELFDLALVGRFIAWNCLRLGWTKERFEEFDTGQYTAYRGRITPEGKTERIGKKYQWIGFYTILGYLADNFVMKPDWGDHPRTYDNPSQVNYTHLVDPARWLVDGGKAKASVSDEDNFWKISALPPWPLPERQSVHEWASAEFNDLPATDVIAMVPELPPEWGEGLWLNLASEHVWKAKFAPGYWAMGKDFHSDIWWQIIPRLIRKADLDTLVSKLGHRGGQVGIKGIERIHLYQDTDIPIAEWPQSSLSSSRSRGKFVTNLSSDDYFPVPWLSMVGECGHPDKRDEHRPVMMPMPHIFSSWSLELDLRRGLVLRNGQPFIGLAGWVLGKDALFVKTDLLLDILAEQSLCLTWIARGERRAFEKLGDHRRNSAAGWVNLYGVYFLGDDCKVHTAFTGREIRNN